MARPGVRLLLTAALLLTGRGAPVGHAGWSSEFSRPGLDHIPQLMTEWRGTPLYFAGTAGAFLYDPTFAHLESDHLRYFPAPVGLASALVTAGDSVYVVGSDCYLVENGPDYEEVCEPAVYGWCSGESWRLPNPGPNETYPSAACKYRGRLVVALSDGTDALLSSASVRVWDGSSWQSMGTLPPPETCCGDARVYQFLPLADRLVAVGLLGRTGLFEFDGTHWVEKGEAPPGYWPEQRTLAVHRGEIVATAYVSYPARAMQVRRLVEDRWVDLGGVFDGPAYALVDYRGELVVAGDFRHVDRIAVNHIAIWRDGVRTALGGGTSAPVYDAMVATTQLYISGRFATAGGVPAPATARWDGARWHSVLPQGHGFLGEEINAIVGFRGETIVAGDFYWSNGRRLRPIVRWTDAGWESLADTVKGLPSELHVLGDELYVHGLRSVDGIALPAGWAVWDGRSWRAWSQVQEPLASDITCMTRYRGETVLGGSFYFNGVRAAAVRWNGSSWEPLGNAPGTPGRALVVVDDELWVYSCCWDRALHRWDGARWEDFTDRLGAPTWSSGPYAAFQYRGRLVVGSHGRLLERRGDSWFDLAPGVESTYCTFRDQLFARSGGSIVRWVDGSWQTLGEFTDGRLYGFDPRAEIHAFAVTGNRLWVGGTFAEVDGTPAAHIAAWMDDSVPTLVTSFQAAWEGGKAQVRWTLAAGAGVERVELSRAGRQGDRLSLGWFEPHATGYTDFQAPASGATYFLEVFDESRARVWEGCAELAAAGDLVFGQFALEVSPNPSRGGFRMTFRSAVSGVAELTIYDVRGRRVACLLPRTHLPAGNATVEWDGRGESAAPVAAGAYVAVLKWGDRRITRKLTVGP